MHCKEMDLKLIIYDPTRDGPTYSLNGFYSLIVFYSINVFYSLNGFIIVTWNHFWLKWMKQCDFITQKKKKKKIWPNVWILANSKENFP